MTSNISTPSYSNASLTNMGICYRTIVALVDRCDLGVVIKPQLETKSFRRGSSSSIGLLIDQSSNTLGVSDMWGNVWIPRWNFSCGYVVELLSE